LLAALIASTAGAAEIFARRMAIQRTPEGEATVFRDSVVITDDDTRIDAGLARMYERRGMAVISDQMVITSPDATIWADSARYFLDDRRAELFGNVRVRQESLDIHAPQLVYYASDKRVVADAGVSLQGRTRPFQLHGRKGRYDLARDIGLVDSEPVLTWTRDRDTARVTGDRMTWYEADARAVAEGDVRVRSGASELECDTVVFFSGPDSGLALGSPKMKDSNSKASGDTMVFFVRSGALEQVGVRGHAAGQYRTDGGELIDVSGRTIDLRLAGGDVQQIEISMLTSGQLVRNSAGGRGGND
jgi:lipopolysaccharide export system protein LptA